MEVRASIGIFQRQVETEDSTRPITPAAVFEAAKQVINTKSVQMVRTNDGLYIVTYSETGPFDIKTDDWLPVQVFKLKQWASGGIKKNEIEEYEAKVDL